MDDMNRIYLAVSAPPCSLFAWFRVSYEVFPRASTSLAPLGRRSASHTCDSGRSTSLGTMYAK